MMPGGGHLRVVGKPQKVAAHRGANTSFADLLIKLVMVNLFGFDIILLLYLARLAASHQFAEMIILSGAFSLPTIALAAVSLSHRGPKKRNLRGTLRVIRPQNKLDSAAIPSTALHPLPQEEFSE